jgi:hypothetical protein
MIPRLAIATALLASLGCQDKPQNDDQVLEQVLSLSNRLNSLERLIRALPTPTCSAAVPRACPSNNGEVTEALMRASTAERALAEIRTKLSLIKKADEDYDYEAGQQQLRDLEDLEGVGK